MIPTDLGSRLSLATESSVQPLTPVKEAASDIPGLVPGMRISARIESLLSNGNLRASVGGQTITLSVTNSNPEKPVSQLAALSPGQTLDLTVLSRTPRLLITQLVDTSNSSAATSLSRPGQLISALLAQGSPSPAALARGEALLATPSAESFSQLPNQLHQAVSESGLFYESHQVQWLAGQRPTEALLREPQGSHSPLLQAASGGDTATRTAADTSATSAAVQGSAGDATRSLGLPADLAPLVQQQLDAASTGHLMWTGQIWPGQNMEWHIEEDGQRRDAGAEDTGRQWKTSLRLNLPNLGQIEASMTLTPSGVSIALASSAASDAALRAAAPQLDNALAAAGVPLTGLQVQNREQP